MPAKFNLLSETLMVLLHYDMLWPIESHTIAEYQSDIGDRPVHSQIMRSSQILEICGSGYRAVTPITPEKGMLGVPTSVPLPLPLEIPRQYPGVLYTPVILYRKPIAVPFNRAYNWACSLRNLTISFDLGCGKRLSFACASLGETETVV